jgi:hypothetical protein
MRACVFIDLILCWRFTISIGRASELGDHSYVANARR